MLVILEDGGFRTAPVKKGTKIGKKYVYIGMYSLYRN